MTKTSCPTFSSQLLIDLEALKANYRVLRDKVAPAECSAVVKADAYGLGAQRVASALYGEGCRTFFVSQLCEALDLRTALPVGCSLFILNGLDPGGEEVCASWGIVPVLNSSDQVSRWSAEARRRRRRLPAAIQIETGMSRLGIPGATLQELAADGSLREDIDVRLVLTHLACADEPNVSANHDQLRRFYDLAKLFAGVPRSIANSAGTFLSNDYHLELVRPGIALYGVPSQTTCLGITPVVNLRARVLQVRRIEGGSRVGYGHTYAAPAPRQIATVGVGYADGWPRRLGNVGAVWHRDTRLPIVGRISMDSMTVDISGLPPGALAEGDFVDLIGPKQTLDDIAADADTIPYEILTRLGARHARAYLEGRTTTMLAPGEPF